VDLSVRRLVPALPEAVGVLEGPFVGKAVDELEDSVTEFPKGTDLFHSCKDRPFACALLLLK
jgi:hypothetical protein